MEVEFESHDSSRLQLDLRLNQLSFDEQARQTENPLKIYEESVFFLSVACLLSRLVPPVPRLSSPLLSSGQCR